MKKRIWSAILVICMLFTLAPAVTPSASAFDSGIWSYYTDGAGHATIFGCSSDASGEVAIPVLLDENEVIRVQDGTFDGCNQITKLTIPGNVEQIAADFHDCTSLAEIYVDVLNPNYSSIDGVLFNKDGQDLLAYPAAKSGTYQIPATMRRVTTPAFSYARNITGFDTSLNANYIVQDGILCAAAYPQNPIRCATNKTGSVSFSANVNRLEVGLFANCKKITSVSIPENVDTIYMSTFENCEKLETINGLESATRIGDYAFFNCKALRPVYFSGSITEIGEKAFADCTSLQSITIPSTMWFIGEGAFSGCTKLFDLTIYSDKTVLPEEVFSGCSALEMVAVPGSITHIAGRAFADCVSLKRFEMPQCDPGSVTKRFTRYDPQICQNAFSGCTSLKTVAVSDNITSVSGLRGCTALENVMLPEGLVEIGYEAFSGCTALQTITIPDSVTNINNRAFYGCSALSTVKTASSDYNTVPSGVKTIGDSVFSGCSSLASFTIPSGVTSISSRAFQGCTALKSIVIPNTVTSLGEAVFASCTGLTNVSFAPGSSITKLSPTMFHECTGLVSFAFPDSLLTIPDRLFYGCSRLETVTIPASVYSIQGSAFEGSSLLDIQVDSQNLNYCAKNGVVFDKNETTLVAYPTGRVGAYTIPSGVKSIGTSAFAYAAGLSGITIPNTVQSIGARAFFECSALPSVTIPLSVVTMGQEAFAGCNGLTSVTVPGGVTSLSPYVFDGCDNLLSITLPSTLKTMGKDCIYSQKLKDIYFEGTYDQWKEINRHETVDWIIADQGVTVHFLGQESVVPTPTPTPAPPVPTPKPTPMPAELTKNYHFQTFTEPDGNLNRVGMISLLWELAGRPATSVSAEKVFSDVAELTQDQKTAIGWGIERSIANGTAASTYSPYDSVTRSLAIVYLYRYYGNPSVSNGVPYTDVASNVFYYNAVCWQFSSSCPVVFRVSDDNQFRPNEVVNGCCALRWKDGEAKQVHIGYGHEYDTGLVTRAATATTAGEKTYTCVHCGQTKTETIPATGGNTGPAITTQPKAASGNVGDVVKFTIAATGSGLKYQWQYSTDNGKTWTKSSSTSTSATCTLSTADRDGWLYRCIVTDSSGKSVTSNSAKVTVLPAITTQPKDASGKVGDVVKFTIAATGKGLTYQWQYSTDSGKSWTNSSSTSTTATCTLASNRNGWLYRCIVKASNGKTVTSASAKVTVTAAAGPVITTQPQAASGKVGDVLKFTVAATGSGLKYQWQYSTDNGKTWKTSSSTSTSATCTLSTADRDGWLYRCIVTDGSGKSVTSSTAKVTVLPAITQQPKAASGKVGQVVKFTIAATGKDLTYQWQYSEDGGKTWKASSSKTTSATCTLTASRNGWLYRCIVKDAHGKSLTSNTAKVTVLPAITAQPKAASGKVGDKVTFSITATGVGLKYQWQYSTDNGKTWKASSSTSTTATCTLSTADRDGWLYRCIVTDSNGKSVTSSTAKVTVLPAITSQPKAASGRVGQVVKFTIAATGKDLTYQWQYSTDGGKTWTKSSSTSTTATCTLTASRNGWLYRCIVKSSNGKSVTSNTAKVTVITG